MKLRLVKLIEIFEEAGRCERMMPGIKKPGCPKMYDLLKMSYDPADLGYYDKKPGMRPRPTFKQMSCWEAAIDLLLLVNLEERRLIWSRAVRYSWVTLASRFACHRVTIKRRYIRAMIRMEEQLKLNKTLLDNIDKI